MRTGRSRTPAGQHPTDTTDLESHNPGFGGAFAGIITAWIQGVVATLPVGGFNSRSLRASAGLRQARVWRGRPLSLAAMSSRWALVCPDKTVPLGKYWRSSPL